MDATDDNNDLPYISELRIGRFAAVLLPVCVAMACLLATGIYYPTLEDRLWAVHSRAALPAHAEPLDDSTVISLYRASLDCFGCSEYRVQMYGSGRVEYVGDKFVCAFGAHEAVADVREVRRLVDAMVASGYFAFVWKRGPPGIDAPSATSTLQHRGRAYQIHHDLGDDAAPRWLRAMEDEIDRVAGTARWLPDPIAWHCRDPAGGTRIVTMREPIEEPLTPVPHEQPIDF